MNDEAFAARVRDALAAPTDGPLAACFPAPLITAIVAGAEPHELGRLEIALRELLAALSAVGVPRGRQFVLLGSLVDATARATAARWRGALGVPVLLHDPLETPFVPGKSPSGDPYELGSELREAEAVVVVGPMRAGTDGLEGGPGLLCPGVVSARTRAAWESARATGGRAAATAFALDVERALTVDFALLWQSDGSLSAGEGRTRFSFLSSATGDA